MFKVIVKTVFRVGTHNQHTFNRERVYDYDIRTYYCIALKYVDPVNAFIALHMLCGEQSQKSIVLAYNVLKPIGLKKNSYYYVTP